MALVMCKSRGCPHLADTTKDKGYCDTHADQRPKTFERKTSPSKLYNTTEWRRERRCYLDHNPLCVKCEERGILRPATVVDHKIRHKDNLELFWDVSNWAALCARCHNSKSARESNE